MNIEYSEVFSRLMKRLGVETDAQLASRLGVSPQTLSTWKRRGTIPYEKVIDVCIQNEYSLDEILLGNRVSGSINQSLLKQVLDSLHSPESEFRHMGLEHLLDTVVMMYNSVYNLESSEAKLVLNAQLKALNLHASTSLARTYAVEASKNRKLLENAPDLIDQIPEPYKYVVKAILNDTSYQLPKDLQEYLDNTTKDSNVGTAKIEQNIDGTNHTIAGRDISITK